MFLREENKIEKEKWKYKLQQKQSKFPILHWNKLFLFAINNNSLYF